MVRNLVVLLIIFGFSKTLLAEEKEVFDAKSLKQRLKDGADYRQSAADRMKATRADKDSLKVISEHDIKYQLPNGEFVAGILLPNGKKAPALKSRFGLRPACVTRDFQLVFGVWNDELQAIQCEIPAEELAILELEGEARSQVGANGSTSEVSDRGNSEGKGADGEKTFADKYSGENASVDGEGGSQNGNSNSDNESSSPTNTAQANKYGGSSKNTSSLSAKGNVAGNGANAGKKQIAKKNIYIPPARGGSVSAAGGSIKVDKNKYGIVVGTWIEAELTRTATSAETGQIEITLLENVRGKFQSLPAGTVLFADKYFNVANRRLEARTAHGITPEGNEIPSIEAYVYSLDQTAGLSGSIVRDREGEVLSAGTNTLLRTAARTVPGTSGLAATAASDFTQEMLSNEENYAPETPDAVITVSPQRVLLKISKTF